MSDINSNNDVLDFVPEKDESLKTLKTLTVLTFIGCGVSYLFILLMPSINRFLLGMMDKAMSSGKELSAKELADIEKGKEVIALTQVHMIPLIIVGIIATTLCLVGAIWMRKLKKDGFWMYSAGEIMPVITNFIFLGTAQFSGVMSVVIGLAVPALFISLYAMQRKHLVA